MSKKFSLKLMMLLVVEAMLLLCAICTAIFTQTKAVAEEANAYDIKVVGVSVRLADDEKNGIRFLTKIPIENYNELKDQMMETGTLLVPEFILGENELTLDYPEAQVATTTQSLKVQADGVYTTVYLYNIPSQAYAEDIVVRSYVKLMDGTLIYGKVAKSSFAYAATSVLDNASYQWTTEQKAILNSYRPQYTVTFEGDNENAVIVRWGDKLTEYAPDAPDGYKNVWYNGAVEYDLNEGVKSNLNLTSQAVVASVLPESNVIPFYKDDGQKMMISSFQEPRNSTDEEMNQAFQNIVDSGINTVFSWGGYKERFLNYCWEYGLQYLPFMGEEKMLEMVQTPLSIPAEKRAAMKGFYYIDEPSYNQIDQLADVARVHAANYPDLDFFVNLHPCWLDAEGVEDNAYNGHTYEEYVAHYCETVFPYITTNRILSVDVYPLIEADNAIKEDWLKSYSILAKYAKLYDAELHIYVCSTEHNGYRAPTLSNLKYMTNVALCYNMDALGYFTYVSYEDQGFGDGLVSPDGLTKYDSYYYAQTVNQDLLKWDEVLRSFEWQDNMCIKGTSWFYHTSGLYEYDPYKVTSMDIIKSVTATRDTIIGRFSGKNGETGLMITNFSDPVRNLSDTVKITFTDGDYVIVYKDGIRTIQTLNNGQLSVTLGAGDGVFVIPFKLANYMQAKSGCTVTQTMDTYYNTDGVSYAFTAASQNLVFGFSSTAPQTLTDEEDIVFYVKGQAGLTATLTCELTNLNVSVTFTDGWTMVRIPREIYLTAIRRGSGFEFSFNSSSVTGTEIYISPVKVISAWSNWVPAD